MKALSIYGGYTFPSLLSLLSQVYSTAWTNNDLEVDIISGRFKNFNTAVRRNDDCVFLVVAGNVSVSCSLSIRGVIAELVTEPASDRHVSRSAKDSPTRSKHSERREDLASPSIPRSDTSINNPTMLRLLVICLAVVAVSSQRSQTTTERYEDTLYKFLDLLEDDDPSRVPGAPVFTGPRSTYRPSVPPRRIFRPIRPIPSVSSPALPGGTIRDANAYMDTIMQQKMPRLLKASPRLYPSAVIPFFKFKVLKTGFTNRDLKVNMTAGVFRGFDTGIRRLGDCDKPSHVGRNTSVSCTLDFSGITASFVAVTKGDDLAGTIKAVPVNVVVRTGAVRIEATAAPGKEAILRTFLIDYVNLDVAHGANLSLNEDRDRGFKHHVRTNVARELDALMHEEYAPLLGRAIATTDLPKAA
ncbi:hypothetical protein MTO96_047535 [Rhipicephalus appendiculatus]